MHFHWSKGGGQFEKRLVFYTIITCEINVSTFRAAHRTFITNASRAEIFQPFKLPTHSEHLIVVHRSCMRGFKKTLHLRHYSHYHRNEFLVTSLTSPNILNHFSIAILLSYIHSITNTESTDPATSSSHLLSTVDPTINAYLCIT